MSVTFSRTVLWLFSAFFIFTTIRGISREIRNVRRHNLGWLTGLTGFLVLVGMGGFLAQSLVGTGALPLPNSFQWPAGNVKGVAKTPDGIYVVPLVPASRVQLYDSQWRFLFGWSVDTGGKDFIVGSTPDGVIEVRTSAYEYSFSQDGRLLNKERARMSVDESRSILSFSSQSVAVPTSPYLWIFSSPFLSWGVGVLGMIGLRSASRAIRPKT